MTETVDKGERANDKPESERVSEWVSKTVGERERKSEILPYSPSLWRVALTT
jgi:hypothetical protein